MSLLSPKICGKEVLNAGAACTAGNATLPTEEDRVTYTVWQFLEWTYLCSLCPGSQRCLWPGSQSHTSECGAHCGRN